MDALGMIETFGLIGAIEGADVMLKVADVSLLEKTIVGGGNVTITVTGDVAAVQASVDAAAAAINKLGEGLLVSKHVIARPIDNISSIIGPSSNEDWPHTPDDKECNGDKPKDEPAQALPTATITKTAVKATAKNDLVQTIYVDKVPTNRDELESSIKQNGIEKTLQLLDGVKVVELRTLARCIDNFGINGRELAKSNKSRLLAEFERYYKNR